jgi:hypothetical protein
MQPWLRARMNDLTRRSSSEWKEITASRPPGASSSKAPSRPRSRLPSSSLTAIRSAWKTRLAGWPPANRAGVGTAERTTSTRSCVVAIGASRRRRPMARAIGRA